MTHTGRMMADARRAKGMSESDLVLAAGYSDVEKGARRLRSIEDGSDPLPDEDALGPFAKALGLGEEDILQALCSDFDALDAPGQPDMVVRWMPGFYGRVALPSGISEGDAIEHARRFSAGKNLRCCVRLSRIRCVYVEPDGAAVLSFSPPHSSFPLSAGYGDRLLKRLAKRLVVVEGLETRSSWEFPPRTIRVEVDGVAIEGLMRDVREGSLNIEITSPYLGVTHSAVIPDVQGARAAGTAFTRRGVIMPGAVVAAEGALRELYWICRLVKEKSAEIEAECRRIIAEKSTATPSLDEPSFRRAWAGLKRSMRAGGIKPNEYPQALGQLKRLRAARQNVLWGIRQSLAAWLKERYGIEMPCNLVWALVDGCMGQ